jgi:hypothetical protein
MTLLQLLEQAGAAVAAWGGRHPIWTTLAIIGATVGSTVTVKKMELPVYNWARDWINARLDGLGKRLTASLMAKVDEIADAQEQLSKRLEGHIGEAERTWATEDRQHILDFSTGLSNGTVYDYEAFRQVMLAIDKYEAYCREHPEYPNSLATGAIQHIRDEFQHFLHN